MIIFNEFEEELRQPRRLTAVKQAVGDTVLPFHGGNVHIKNNVPQAQGHDNQMPLNGSIPYYIAVKTPALLNRYTVSFQVFLNTVKIFQTSSGRCKTTVKSRRS